MKSRRRLGWWFVLAGVVGGLSVRAAGPAWMARGPVVVNDDGGWCWFEDERALVIGDRLVFGSVAMGRADPKRKGDIEATGVDLRSGRVDRFTLHAGLQADDHNSPAFVERSDGRLLAMYARHGSDARIYWRVTRQPGNPTVWEPERVFEPSPSSRVTYSNPHRLEREAGRGRIYNFFRGLDNSYKPSWMFSDDDGATWTTGGLLVDVEDRVRHRPYAKYASDGRDTVHVAFTEGHPRDFDNGIYHAVIRRGVVQRSEGVPIRALAEGPIRPPEATRVFGGDANNVAWIQDLACDGRRRARMVYSVQKDSAGLAPGKGGTDHRYHWARWDGWGWWGREIAYAGSRLYAGEDDYVGGICLHPDDPDVVFCSTNVDPATGQPLAGGHYELFLGRTRDDGYSWTWEPLTPGATEDQLRPIVPRWRRGRTALLWLQGRYRAYTDYDLSVLCWIR